MPGDAVTGDERDGAAGNPQRGRPKRQKPLPEGTPQVIRGPDETVFRGILGSGGPQWELRR